ncbi:MAG: leucine-rich repeat domain-containing protein [Chloroflexota bacterium]|nr:leucine-rich repeat domain-containing protein [Chloroflexota bacterium]MDE2941757.1 leucine-rich repeat domain-containing protein [Chloroflexota bacterium]MDE3268482.1 leucine-rich repeat domain-containing protein [Chloroflexota bacterium]
MNDGDSVRGRHPPACTCVDCTSRRLLNDLPTKRRFGLGKIIGFTLVITLAALTILPWVGIKSFIDIRASVEGLFAGGTPALSHVDSIELYPEEAADMTRSLIVANPKCTGVLTPAVSCTDEITFAFPTDADTITEGMLLYDHRTHDIIYLLELVNPSRASYKTIRNSDTYLLTEEPDSYSSLDDVDGERRVAIAIEKNVHPENKESLNILRTLRDDYERLYGSYVAESDALDSDIDELLKDIERHCRTAHRNIMTGQFLGCLEYNPARADELNAREADLLDRKAELEDKSREASRARVDFRDYANNIWQSSPVYRELPGTPSRAESTDITDTETTPSDPNTTSLPLVASTPLPSATPVVVETQPQPTEGRPPELPTAAGTSSEADREALVALFNATGGQDWSDNTGWLSNKPISEWAGVTTDANGGVTRLSLTKNELSGEIPPEVGNLVNLKELRLGENPIVGEIPPELGNLHNLQTLSLHWNQLSGEIPPELGLLSNLQHLSLDGNPIGGQIPPDLGNLLNLRLLNLNQTQLSGRIPPALGNLLNLQSLSLRSNQLSGEIPRELGLLSNLQALSLDGNQFSGEIPPALGNLASLQVLILGKNQLSGEIPPELGNLPNLRHLSLDDNQFSGAIPPALGNLPNLQLVGLAKNQLSGEIPPELGNLASLQYLNLSGNHLSGGIPPELGNLPNLQSLYVVRNQLSGEIPPELGNLANLQYMSLSGNQLSGDIPPELGNLPNLQRLSLDGNQLNGCVPSSLQGQLDQSSNLGGIPFC